LVPAFTRSLRDGFFHARIAALMALNGKLVYFAWSNGTIIQLIYAIIATSEYYDAQECAMKIVPAVSMVLVDKEKYAVFLLHCNLSICLC
jgi:SCY1-like protein 1